MSPDAMFWLELATKMAVTAAFLVAATAIAERAGPLVGGLVATLPISAGPVYLFLALDRVGKLHEKLPWKPLRRLALRRARQWLLEHLERSDGLAAIYPAMVNSVFALLALGYSADDPLTAREIGHLADLEIEESDTLRLRPCLSPVWDTAIVMTASCVSKPRSGSA